MKFFLPYCLIFSLLVLVSCSNQNKHTLPSLTETYRKTDKRPFGSLVAYNGFKNLYRDRYVEIVTDPFDETWNDIKVYSTDKKYSLYFLITKNLVLNNAEINAFLDYVKEGNDLFISADYIDNRLLENINCNTERDSEIVKELNGVMHSTHVSMYFGENFNVPSYSYYYYPFLNSLSNFDTAFARVLGVNEMNTPNYIILFSGRGRIYLHVAPRIFSNYFLLTGDNYKYFENVISYLRSDPKNIYWDEYYKNTNSSRRKNNNSNSGDDNFSSLNVIRQHPPLLWAFWIGIAGLLLFVLFNTKRKQRVINIVRPNINTTVTFTETVGRLYLQKKDNNHIAEKMITYFYEHIRNKYFISTANINDEFINSLSGKSGVSHEQTKQIFSLIAKAQSGKDISDMELLKLNSEIEKFKKIKS